MSFLGRPPSSSALLGARAHLIRRVGQELRCGCPVIVCDGDVRTLVASLDAATPATVSAIVRSSGEVRLVVGAGRAASSLPSAAALPPNSALALRMPGGCFDPERVLDASSPLAPREEMTRVAVEDAPPWATSLLASAKAEGLLPILVHAPSADVEADPEGAGDGLMAVSLALLEEPSPRRVRLDFCGAASLPLRGCERARILSYRSSGRGQDYLAIEVGRPAQVDAPLVRIHSSCLTGDLFGSLRCDCGEQLTAAIARIAAEGSGLILYLPQEGRGIGLANKLRAYRLQDEGLDTLDANHALGWESDARCWDAAVEMLEQRGVTRLRLLSNNREKAAALVARGIEVVERLQHQVRANAFNGAYIATKMARCGHGPDMTS